MLCLPHINTWVGWTNKQQICSMKYESKNKALPSEKPPSSVNTHTETHLSLTTPHDPLVLSRPFTFSLPTVNLTHGVGGRWAGGNTGATVSCGPLNTHRTKLVSVSVCLVRNLPTILCLPCVYLALVRVAVMADPLGQPLICSRWCFGYCPAQGASVTLDPWPQGLPCALTRALAGWSCCWGGGWHGD